MFGSLIYTLKHIIERCIVFSFFVALELFMFAVICIILNDESSNSVSNSIKILVDAPMFGIWFGGEILILQILFTIT